MKWICALCDKSGACEFCEMCAEHCVVKRQNDVEAHRKFDCAIACASAPDELGIRDPLGIDDHP